ncbi:phosphate--AMP phosphotransferase [Acinetobacter sp. MD2(2019)]|uniref:polyphosphate:AMP phosphotransferase n=1 Tax=Acinetobacter sp. MD2(2019) TaxID=2605273 RepID=UPI002D1E63B4|nr:phosphate--AMP phosphotransferase [Acinetobacter sp. MD2(2019)]MEB3753527.1 phosphate--AMP phosphotransferase [Acinetobacter sp. MD2(2019)]
MTATTAKQKLKKQEDQLSIDLIEAQYGLKESRGTAHSKSVLIIVSGIELAGKGEAVKQLREWVDPRHLHVKAKTAELLSSSQTFWEPYANSIPAEGELFILFGNWYNDLLKTAMHVSKPLNETLFDSYIEQMQQFEHDLKQNYVDVIKIWFDLSWKSLQKRLDNMNASEQQWHKLHGLDWRNKKEYDTIQKLRQRFSDDWICIDGEDPTQRNQIFAEHVLDRLRDLPEHNGLVAHQWQQAAIPSPLRDIQNPSVEKKSYKKQLKKLGLKVSRAMLQNQRRVVIVFEGMDAAGKGGAIKRIVKRLDPREYEITSIAAPDPFELRHPYLWRFWRKLEENNSFIHIFDRSWYGRVLVERIEGYAQPFEWQRAYDEINSFEKDLVDTRTVVVKIWLAISKDEQEKRFKDREATPRKQYKITDEDWRNRAKWDEYLNAAADMFERSSTQYAPWHIIATDNKRQARLDILKAILKQLKAE